MTPVDDSKKGHHGKKEHFLIFPIFFFRKPSTSGTFKVRSVRSTRKLAITYYIPVSGSNSVKRSLNASAKIIDSSRAFPVNTGSP